MLFWSLTNNWLFIDGKMLKMTREQLILVTKLKFENFPPICTEQHKSIWNFWNALSEFKFKTLRKFYLYYLFKINKSCFSTYKNVFITFLQFRTNARTGIEMSRWDLYKQISVLLVVLLIAPSIIYTNSKMANSSEVRIFFWDENQSFSSAYNILNFFFILSHS